MRSVQIALQVFGQCDVLMHERFEHSAQELVFAVAAVEVSHITTMLAMDTHRNTRQKCGQHSLERGEIARMDDVGTKLLQQPP